MPEKKTAASAANEYIVRNRMTHWQKIIKWLIIVMCKVVLVMIPMKEPLT